MITNFKNMSDEQLYTYLSDKKSNSMKAFDELYNRHSLKIYNYIRKMVINESIANDIFQDAFTRLFESAKTKREMTNFQGYMITIAKNLCLTEKSKNKINYVLIEDVLLTNDEKQYSEKELTELLNFAIEELPLEFKEPLILKEMMDMSYKEISEELGLNISIVRTRIYRAKSRLRDILKPYINDLENIKNNEYE